MSLRKRSVRTIAASSILGLTAGTAAVVGLAAPASADAGSFICGTPIGDQTFAAEISIGATTIAGGNTPMNATFTIPSGLADLMRGVLGTTEVGGKATGANTAGSKASPSSLNIKREEIPTSGDVPLAGKGTAKVPGTVGSTVEVAAGPHELAMNFYDAAGAATPFSVSCTPDGDFAIGSTKIVKATSKAAVGVKYTAKSKNAAVTAKFSSNGAPATGKVQILIKKGKKTVGKRMVALKKQTARASFKIKQKGKYTAIATYKGSANVKGSSAKKAFTAR
ncbi:hypothetical protein [Nocardioides sambongensis]|uniref:hypothetical protein n=1 Tax=Nocardioides sambongensis TaxID=2589074 RepID=UPI001126A0A6|nr:hypothetical protein [Nocardioides sambongensis]